MTSLGAAAPTLTVPPVGPGAVAALAVGAAVAGGQSVLDTVQATGGSYSPDLLPIALVAVENSGAMIWGAPASPVASKLEMDTPLAMPGDLAKLAKGAELGRQALRDAAREASTPRARAGGAVQPVVGRVTSAAGPRDGTTHYGLDVANRIGTPILAVSDGVVERAGPASGFGLWVVLRHPDGSRSVYGHINRALVRPGQRVVAGQQVAEVGNRGQSTGPHLHLEIWDRSGAKIDPQRWLRERGVVMG